jgi:hypothetical protein
MMRAGRKMREVRMPVGPIGNHSHSALQASVYEAVSVPCRGQLTIIPLSHEQRREIA